MAPQAIHQFRSTRVLSLSGPAVEQEDHPPLEALSLEGRKAINRRFEYRLVGQIPELPPGMAPRVLNPVRLLGGEITAHLELKAGGSFIPSSRGPHTEGRHRLGRTPDQGLPDLLNYHEQYQAANLHHRTVLAGLPFDVAIGEEIGTGKSYTQGSTPRFYGAAPDTPQGRMRRTGAPPAPPPQTEPYFDLNNANCEETP